MDLKELRKDSGFRRICRDASLASKRYSMLCEGDCVFVGLSGGEDSLTLMHVLCELQRRSPFGFELIACAVDLGFGTFDLAGLRSYCVQMGWRFESVSLDGQELMRKHDAEERPCAMCSRLRRGQLHKMADELGCNKIALGQQLDDLCVSLLLSMFRGGGLKTMGANVGADGGRKRLIRPLCTITKSRIHAFAKFAGFPQFKSCPYEEQLKRDGDRAYLERLLDQLEERFTDVRSTMLHAMGDVRLGHLLDLRYWSADGEDDPDGGKL